MIIGPKVAPNWAICCEFFIASISAWVRPMACIPAVNTAAAMMMPMTLP